MVCATYTANWHTDLTYDDPINGLRLYCHVVPILLKGVLF
jgi:hypothetical protein